MLKLEGWLLLVALYDMALMQPSQVQTIVHGCTNACNGCLRALLTAAGPWRHHLWFDTSHRISEITGGGQSGVTKAAARKMELKYGSHVCCIYKRRAGPNHQSYGHAPSSCLIRSSKARGFSLLRVTTVPSLSTRNLALGKGGGATAGPRVCGQHVLGYWGQGAIAGMGSTPGLQPLSH